VRHRCLGLFAAFSLATPLFGESHLGRGSSVGENPPVTPDNGGVITFIPLGRSANGGGALGVADGGDANRGRSGGDGSDPGAAKRTSPRSSDGGDESPTLLSFVLYSRANDAAGKRVVEQLRRLGNSRVVPISPLTGGNFTAEVKRTRRLFLDHWWRLPRELSLVAVAPEQPANGLVASDEAAWPLSALRDREKEIAEIFKKRLPSPSWDLLLPIAESSQCHLPILERSGLTTTLPLAKLADRFQRMTGAFAQWNLRKRTAVRDREAPEIYLCQTTYPPAFATDEP
jgi:hypothetical protein